MGSRTERLVRCLTFRDVFRQQSRSPVLVWFRHGRDGTYRCIPRFLLAPHRCNSRHRRRRCFRMEMRQRCPRDKKPDATCRSTGAATDMRAAPLALAHVRGFPCCLAGGQTPRLALRPALRLRRSIPKQAFSQAFGRDRPQMIRQRPMAGSSYKPKEEPRMRATPPGLLREMTKLPS